MGPLNLTMSQIIAATDNFSDSNQIGEGGFGIVYKGTLEDGQVVAIKRAKKVLYLNFLCCSFFLSANNITIPNFDLTVSDLFQFSMLFFYS